MHGDMISIQPQGWIQPCNCRNNNKIKYCRVSRLAIDKLRYLNDWWQTKVFLMKSTTIVMYILMLYLGAQYFLVCSNFSQSNCKFGHYRPCKRGKCRNVQENQPIRKEKGQNMKTGEIYHARITNSGFEYMYLNENHITNLQMQHWFHHYDPLQMFQVNLQMQYLHHMLPLVLPWNKSRN